MKSCVGNCNQGRSPCNTPGLCAHDDAPITIDGVERFALYIVTALTVILTVCFGAWLYAQVWPVVASLV